MDCIRWYWISLQNVKSIELGGTSFNLWNPTSNHPRLTDPTFGTGCIICCEEWIAAANAFEFNEIWFCICWIGAFCPPMLMQKVVFYFLHSCIFSWRALGNMVEIIDNSLRWVRSESHLVTNYPYALTLLHQIFAVSAIFNICLLFQADHRKLAAGQ